jgi:hypothetical protein
MPPRINLVPLRHLACILPPTARKQNARHRASGPGVARSRGRCRSFKRRSHMEELIVVVFDNELKAQVVTKAPGEPVRVIYRDDMMTLPRLAGRGALSQPHTRRRWSNSSQGRTAAGEGRTAGQNLRKGPSLARSRSVIECKECEQIAGSGPGASMRRSCPRLR